MRRLTTFSKSWGLYENAQRAHSPLLVGAKRRSRPVGATRFFNVPDQFSMIGLFLPNNGFAAILNIFLRSTTSESLRGEERPGAFDVAVIGGPELN